MNFNLVNFANFEVVVIVIILVLTKGNCNCNYYIYFQEVIGIVMITFGK